MFESPNQEKISDFEMKLMVIDSEHLGIPETEYNGEVTMPSGEFQKICRDLKEFGETMQVKASKEGITFSVQGDVGAPQQTQQVHHPAPPAFNLDWQTQMPA